MTEAKKRGRPLQQKAPRGRTKSLSMRITEELRTRLEGSANEKGLGLTSEIEERLGQSFLFEDEWKKAFAAFGGEQNFAVCRLVAELMTKVSAVAGTPWSEDAWTYAQVEQGIQKLLENWRPGGKLNKPALSHFPEELAERLGETTAAHMLAALEFIDENQTYPSAQAGTRLQFYPTNKRRLGALGKRSSNKQGEE